MHHAYPEQIPIRITDWFTAMLIHRFAAQLPRCRFLGMEKDPFDRDTIGKDAATEMQNFWSLSIDLLIELWETDSSQLVTSSLLVE